MTTKLHLKALFLILLFSIYQPKLQATTVIPYINLGELAEASDAIVLATAKLYHPEKNGNILNFHYTMRVQEVVSGPLKKLELFEVRAMREIINNWERTVWGDLELEEGKTYLLFLYDSPDKDFWLPMALSYYIFEVIYAGDTEYLVPVKKCREINTVNRPDGQYVERLLAYNKDRLLNKLRSFLDHRIPWQEEDVAVDALLPDDFYDDDALPAPGHCSFLGTGRWLNFPGTALPVRYESTGDPTCGTSVSHIQTAINEMNALYGGINLTDGGGFNDHTPSCVGGAQGGNFLAFVNSTLGGSRNIVVQFDDPCDQIPPLSGCSGTLALGGLYSLGATHTFDNQTWRSAGYGYVIVNDNVGTCLCSNGYSEMIEHEMTHALNIGHISTSAGIANMNPSCCNDISGLDISCLNYLYPPQALPVELVDFNAYQEAANINLSWRTASEQNNDYFTLERSVDGRSYLPIGTVKGIGVSNIANHYNYLDARPFRGANYYRLSQTDFDGHQEVIAYSVVDYIDYNDIVIRPNPLKGSYLNVDYGAYSDNEIEISVYDLNGKLWLYDERELLRGYNNFQLNLSNLPEGVYAIRFTENNTITTRKFIKS